MFLLRICFALLVFFAPYGFAQVTLNIGVIHDNVNERVNFLSLKQAFEQQNPDITVKIIGHPSPKHKERVAHWLASNTGPDVLYWYASNRLFEFAERGLIVDITKTWVENKLGDVFTPNTVSLVTHKQAVYGIPISYYPWVFYYNSAVFQRLGLSPPATWEGFLAICETLKKNGIYPLVVGYGSPWTLSAWFELLNLRLNGSQFHTEVLAGRISYTDSRIKQVFVVWKQLIDAGYFLPEGDKLEWLESFPYLYREFVGMNLMGHFATSRISQNALSKIDVFAFPTLNEKSISSELAPTDVFMVRKGSLRQKEAKIFLEFVAELNFQQLYNKAAGGFSPRLDAVPFDDAISKKNFTQLRDASHISPFFDRVVPHSFIAPVLRELGVFMEQANVEKTQVQLEALRIEHYQIDQP